jgi:hypothetical protein
MKRSFLARSRRPVLPQPGDHQNVGLAHPILQGLGIADGEAIDAGIEGGKPLMQSIRDVSKADRRLIGGRNQGRTPFDEKKSAHRPTWPQPTFRHSHESWR